MSYVLRAGFGLIKQLIISSLLMVWLSRLEFDLVPLVKLLVCVYLILKSLDLAFPSVFKSRTLSSPNTQAACAQQESARGANEGEKVRETENA